MITAGIDIGHKSVSALILDEDRIITHAALVFSGGVEDAAKIAFDRVLEQSGLKRSEIDRVFATGVGREKVTFADGHPTQMLSHVKAAHRLFPGARTVIDMGAEGSRILRCDAEGNLAEFVMNDKCASGAGVFLETVAGMMRMPISEIGPLSLNSSNQVTLTTTCAVFAESEIVAEIHRGSPKADILWAVHDAIAAKVVSASKRIKVEPEIVFTGGVARNRGVAEALKKHLGFPIRIPENPDIVGAMGAAILARNAA